MSVNAQTSVKLGPNPEQQKAIEHQGGVLLSAGAGSGKTFVLIEHMIYLAKTLLEKYKNLSEEALSLALKKEFSSIVLMTFTTKATGELKIRLSRRIGKEIEENPGVRKWLVVKDALEDLHVSTIHGYCSALIKQGFFPNVPAQLSIVDDASFSDKLNQIFDAWFDDQGKEFLSQYPDIEDIFYSNQDQLRHSLQQIFKTPELRESWRQAVAEELCQQNLEEFVAQYFELTGLRSLEEMATFDLGGYQEFSKNAWYPILEGFLRLIKNHPPTSLDSLKANKEFFASIKRLTGPQAKTGLYDVIEAFDFIKEYRSFINEHEEGLCAYLENQHGIFKTWIELVKSAVDYIESHYLSLPGMTFADLEYYVLRGLEDEQCAKRVQERYRYFIVDEFQDTSFIQYTLIEKSCGHDYQKMFCVGDVKQAIYGFRGGELGVFKSCQEVIPKNLELNNNYRSAQRVIDFNNHFFDHLFKLGLKFSGVDKFTVPVAYQLVPEKKDSSPGELNHISVDVTYEGDEKFKLKSADINFYESEAILKEIQRIKKESPKDQICVLYKNLKPSKLLVKSLMDAQIGFTAQVKVPFFEEPVVALFHLMLEMVLEDATGVDEQVQKKKLALTCGYFHYLQLSSASVEQHLKDFYERLIYCGFYEAFQIFIKEIGLLNSNHQNNLKELETLFKNSHGSLEKTYQLLRTRSDGDFSIPFIFGSDPEQVILMTAHGSKGLEFDHVILGGLHTNGSIIPSRDYFGKTPGSMRWKVRSSQKKPFKSPAYLIEEAVEKRKDFSESKRLFYVAATRAVKSLTWCDLSLNQSSVSSTDNSWIVGLRQVITDLTLSKQKFWQELQVQQRVHSFVVRAQEQQGDQDDNSDKEDFLMPPLFHLDTLGVQGSESSKLSMGLVSELSVTGLSQLALCPRKFYLSQICKMKPEQKSFSAHDDRKKESLETEDLEYRPSSMERGTLIHEAISTSIKADFVIPLHISKSLPPKDLACVEWALSECQASSTPETTYLSEEAIKFPFFGHMISGTPDLVIEGECLKIIDFKTGKRKPTDQLHYWYQLMIYAYAFLQNEQERPSTKVEIVLMYVDERLNDSKTLSKEELTETLNQFWKKTAHLAQVNREHCSSCGFGNLCLN